MHIYKPPSQGNTLPHKRAMNIYKPPSQGNTLPHKRAIHIYKPHHKETHSLIRESCMHISRSQGLVTIDSVDTDAISPHYHKATDNNYMHTSMNKIVKFLIAQDEVYSIHMHTLYSVDPSTLA